MKIIFKIKNNKLIRKKIIGFEYIELNNSVIDFIESKHLNNKIIIVSNEILTHNNYILHCFATGMLTTKYKELEWLRLLSFCNTMLLKIFKTIPNTLYVKIKEQ